MTHLQRAYDHAILFLLALNLAFGIATGSDYGESWDEARLYEYADQSLHAYRAVFDPAIPVDLGKDDLRYYGPAYLMGMLLLVKGVHFISPQTATIDLWHVGNFACLQMGLLCFYVMARRSVNSLPALGATALFASQPLLWGHGFINPKDIPFMAFFTASVFLGLKMLDELEGKNFELRSLIRSRWFYLAVVTLGLTISIRILGFAAGAIVLFYFAFTNPGRVLRLSYPYFGSALVVSLLTWPYLWPSPLVNFLQGIYAMLKFQWVGHTLFNGMYYASSELPRAYVPQLFLMQFTEPVLLLFAIGIAALLLPRFRQRHRRLVILFLLWFILPMLYILINGMNLYDNTRQLFFIFPGAFLVIAAGLDLLFAWIKPRWAQLLLVAAFLLPGIVGILRYHPYEYTYYNFFTTSSRQIFRNFETDYWATSFKEISSYLNENAPEHSLVIAWGPAHLLKRYARPDLQVKSFDDLQDREYASQPYFLVLTTRYDMDLKHFPEIEPVYSVTKNGSVLSVVKYIQPRK